MRPPDEIDAKIARIVVGWASLVRYFPANEIGQQLVMELVRSMVSNDRDTAMKQLDWLTSQMVNTVGEWQGAKELRGVFCSRFQPRDGVEVDSTHPAFNAAAGEAKSIEQERRSLSEAKRRLMLAPGDVTADYELNAQIKALAERKKLQ